MRTFGIHELLNGVILIFGPTAEAASSIIFLVGTLVD
jgi:hypothetical protein